MHSTKNFILGLIIGSTLFLLIKAHLLKQHRYDLKEKINNHIIQGYECLLKQKFDSADYHAIIADSLYKQLSLIQ